MPRRKTQSPGPSVATRKVTFGGAISLDNFIARKNDAVDWLVWDKEVGSIMKEFWKTIDTVLMGRRTYEVAAGSGYGGSNQGVKTYLFSRTLKKSPHKKVELVTQDAVDFVRELKQQEGKGICLLGGGLLARSFFEAGLIDEITFNVQPVLLGSGIPLFYEMSHQINLELFECRQLGSGSVVLSYRVKH